MLRFKPDHEVVQAQHQQETSSTQLQQLMQQQQQLRWQLQQHSPVHQRQELLCRSTLQQHQDETTTAIPSQAAAVPGSPQDTASLVNHSSPVRLSHLSNGSPCRQQRHRPTSAGAVSQVSIAGPLPTKQMLFDDTSKQVPPAELWQRRQELLAHRQLEQQQHCHELPAEGAAQQKALCTANQQKLAPAAAVVAAAAAGHGVIPSSGGSVASSIGLHLVALEPDEAELQGELMTAIKRGGGGLRAEAILEQLLQQLGAARAGLVAEAGEVRVLRSRLAELQQEHTGCDAGRRLLKVRQFF